MIMEKAPAFFVPASTPENQETNYSDLAKMAGRTVPPIERRIHSITFTHNGEEWTATVGEKLTGVKYKTSRGNEITGRT
jgi:hypothetical protein